MATDGFKFWDSYYDALRAIPTDEQRGRLVMAVCSYVFENVRQDVSDDAILAVVYPVMCEQSKESKRLSKDAQKRGKRGGRPPKSSETSAKSSGLSTAKSYAKSDKTRADAMRADASIAGAAGAGAGRPAGGGAPAPARYDDLGSFMGGPVMAPPPDE